MPETNMTQRVLVIEDEDALRSAIAAHLRAHGFDVHLAATHADARVVLATVPMDAVVLDHRVSDGEAFDLLPDVFARNPRPVVIVLTAYGSIDLAVRLVKEGVQQFLTKPIDLAILVSELRQHLGQRAALAKRAQPAPRVSGTQQRAVNAPFFGPSHASLRLRDDVARLREVDGPVLVTGEVGTGKSTLARYLHVMSSRGRGPFFEVSGAALSREHGLFEAAHGGTLVVDEIGDIDPATQTKLLDVLERQAHDVRIIAVTRRDPMSGALRPELHARLTAITIAVPPLRERAEDIVPLARQFLDMLAGSLGRTRATLTPEAEAALVAHTWPGNVRELKNSLERALVLGDGGLVQANDIQFGGGPSLTVATPSFIPRMSGVPVRSLEYVEIEHIRNILADVGGRVDAAAVELQMPRSTLYERIRRYGIDLTEFRARRKSPS